MMYISHQEGSSYDRVHCLLTPSERKVAMYIMCRRLYSFALIACLSAIFVTSCSPASKPSIPALVPASLKEGILYYRGHRNGITPVAWSPPANPIPSPRFTKTGQAWD